MAFITVIPNRLATRPTWAEVSLPDLRNNFRLVEKHVGPGVTICAVVKADAYGHGAVECSTALEEEGARWLGVTSLDEAIPLREAGVQARILLMTGFWHGEEEEIIRLNLTPTVWELWQVQGMEKAAAELGVNRYPVHLKVDSGMGRLGAGLEELPQACATLRSAPSSFTRRSLHSPGIVGSSRCRLVAAAARNLHPGESNRARSRFYAGAGARGQYRRNDFPSR